MDFICRGANGFRVAVGDARDKVVINQDGYYVSPGTETLSAMTFTVSETTPKALERLRPDQRNCYVDNEFGFKYLRSDAGFRYSMQNCLYESVLQHIIENCKCAPYFLNFRIKKGLNLNKLSVCQGQSLTCSTTLLKNFGSEQNPDLSNAISDTGTRMKCLQRCDYSLNYYRDVSFRS
jgi:hypothetical protein